MTYQGTRLIAPHAMQVPQSDERTLHEVSVGDRLVVGQRSIEPIATENQQDAQGQRYQSMPIVDPPTGNLANLQNDQAKQEIAEQQRKEIVLEVRHPIESTDGGHVGHPEAQEHHQHEAVLEPLAQWHQ